MSRAVVIIEAALRSGSLITARAAADQGRDVMAAPGSPLDPRARGSNALIKQGATLIESAEDVIAALGDAAPQLRPLSAGPLFADATSNRRRRGCPRKIAALLSPTPVHVNDLARLVDAPAGAVAAALTELELNGQAASMPGGYAASSGAALSVLSRASRAATARSLQQQNRPIRATAHCAAIDRQVRRKALPRAGRRLQW